MESKTENRINECISHLDITYSYQLAKQMETHKTNPVLGFRTAGSDAEHKTGDFFIRRNETHRTSECDEGWNFWLGFLDL